MAKRPNIEISNRLDGEVKDYGDERGQTRSEAYTELLDHALDFRPPTDEEREHLIEWLIENRFGAEYNSSYEEAAHLVETTASVAVLDGFISDVPGYAGPLVFVVYGYPETYTLYQYADDGETLTEVPREAQK
jgi:hypothetical protein